MIKVSVETILIIVQPHFKHNINKYNWAHILFQMRRNLSSVANRCSVSNTLLVDRRTVRLWGQSRHSSITPLSRECQAKINED